MFVLCVFIKRKWGEPIRTCLVLRTKRKKNTWRKCFFPPFLCQVAIMLCLNRFLLVSLFYMFVFIFCWIVFASFVTLDAHTRRSNVWRFLVYLPTVRTYEHSAYTWNTCRLWKWIRSSCAKHNIRSRFKDTVSQSNGKCYIPFETVVVYMLQAIHVLQKHWLGTNIEML